MRPRTIALAIVLLVVGGASALGQTREERAKDTNLFLQTFRKALKWDEPADPVTIAGPLYFVGTRGLGSWLFNTSEGHILLNTGMPE